MEACYIQPGINQRAKLTSTRFNIRNINELLLLIEIAGLA